MATIIIEDGTGLLTSNSYASEAELIVYAGDRGVVITGIESELLITAMDYIEQQTFKGTKNTQPQALQWPRYGVVVDSYVIESDTIPQLLKDCQMEAALAVDAGNNPSGSVERSTKRETLGPMTVEYMDGARDKVYNKALETKLTKLLQRGSGGISTIAIRA